MDFDTIVYLTLLLMVWLVPSVSASRGIIWAGLYVLLQWFFFSSVNLSDNAASIISGVSLLSVYGLSRLFWEDPFSRARVSRLIYSQLDRAGWFLDFCGIRPQVCIRGRRSSYSVNQLIRLLQSANWRAAEDKLMALSFEERVRVIECLTDAPQCGDWIEQWSCYDEAGPLVLLVRAQFHIKIAWECRGSGVDYTVTTRAHNDFHRHLDIAKCELQQLIDQDDNLPDPYLGLITIAMGSGGDPDKLYDYYSKAISRSEQRYDIQLAMLNALSEKWGGEPGEACAFARQVMNDCQPNNPDAGIVAVAHIERWLYLQLSGQNHRAREYFSKAAVIDDLDQAYSLLYASTLDSEEHIQALNALAFCFYMGDQYTTAKRIFDQLDGNFVLYPWLYCSEPVLSIVNPAFAIDLVARRLEGPLAMRA